MDQERHLNPVWEGRASDKEADTDSANPGDVPSTNQPRTPLSVSVDSELNRILGIMKHGWGQTLIVFLIAVAMVLIQYAVTDYVGYRVCRERAHHISNATDADVCPAKKWCDAQDEVTKSTASWMQLVNLVYTLPGVVVLGVAGPFSDAFGRKPVLIIASTIQLLSTGVLLVTAIWDLPLYFIVIGYGIAGATGNYVVVLSVLFASAADLSLCTDDAVGGALAKETNESDTHADDDQLLNLSNSDDSASAAADAASSARTTLVAFVEGGLYLGAALGAIVFGQLGHFIRSGCSHVIYFAVGAGLYAVALVAVYVVPETLTLGMRRKWPGWRHANLFAALAVLCQSRRLALLTVVFVTQCLTFFGYAAVAQLYTAASFGWGDADWGYFAGINAIASGVGMLLVVPLLQYRLKRGGSSAHTQDIVVLLLTLGFGCAQFSSYAVVPSTAGTAFFGIAGAGFIAAVQPPLIRSLISKQVPPDQLGTVFGAAATVEAVAQLVWPIATLQTYKSTVGTLPSAFYILGAVGSALSFCVVFTTMRKPSEVASPRMSMSIQADVPEGRTDARAEEPTTALLGQSET